MTRLNRNKLFISSWYAVLLTGWVIILEVLILSRIIMWQTATFRKEWIFTERSAWIIRLLGDGNWVIIVSFVFTFISFTTFVIVPLSVITNMCHGAKMKVVVKIRLGHEISPAFSSKIQVILLYPNVHLRLYKYLKLPCVSQSSYILWYLAHFSQKCF